MGFKVTLRKNGQTVGQAHYPAEAVAVGVAKKMNGAASGVEATVEACPPGHGAKSNRRRRRNGASGSEEAYWQRVLAELDHTAGKAAKSRTRRIYSPHTKETMARIVALDMDAPRRRNGTDPVAAMDALTEGDTVEITASGIGPATVKTIKGTVIQRSNDYLVVSGTRGGKYRFRRNAHPLLPAPSWYLDGPRYATVRGVVKANPRRRNGTTAANIAASRSLARARNSGTIAAYVPAYLGLPRHGGSVILAQHPSDKMPTVVGIGTAPTAFQRAQYAGCKLSVVPASSVKAHRIGG